MSASDERFKKIEDEFGPMLAGVRRALDTPVPGQLSPQEHEMEHRLRAAFEPILEVALDGANTDGAHHKQFALREVCRMLGAEPATISDQVMDPGIPA